MASDLTTVITSPAAPSTRSVSWGAIVAGCVAALTVHLLATLLGMGLGFGVSNPLTNDDLASDMTVGLGITWSISALIALWVGGWVAGRGARTTNVKLGGLHGFLVWCTATVLMALFLSSSAGALIGGAAKLAGRSLAVAGKGAAAVGKQAADAAPDNGGNMLQQFVQQNSDFIGSFLNDLTGPAAGGAQRPPLTATAKREIGWSLYRFFSQDKSARTPEVRDEAVRTIAQQAGMSEADARTRLDELARSYDRAQDDLKATKDRAEQKAREAADRAKGTVAKSAIWTVVAFIVGALAASWGGRRGASRAWEDVYPETRATVPPLT